jgi:hypothetical protein
MGEIWGKQRSYEMPNGYSKQYEQEKSYGGYAKQPEMEKAYGGFKPCCHEKSNEYPRPCEQEKQHPKPCYPPMPCEDKACHFCGYTWRKCPCCGRCCCCKVWNCGGYYVYECSECGEVFWTSCEEECYKK